MQNFAECIAEKGKLCKKLREQYIQLKPEIYKTLFLVLIKYLLHL